MSGLSSHRARRAAFSGLLFLAFAGLFIYPIARLLLMPWLPALEPAEGIGVHASTLGLSPVAIINTVRLGLASTLVAVPLGLGFGWLLERRAWRGKRLFMLTLWLVFLTPSYLLTTGWQIVFSQPFLHHGHLARLFFGQAGIVALLGLKGFPFACLAARGSWRAIGTEIVDAARIHVAGAWQRRGVLLRLLLPAVGSAFAIVFIESIQEFGIPATLGAQIHLPIVTYAIYERLAMTPVDFTDAALLSWTLVVLAAGAASVHFYLGRRYGSALVHGRQRQSASPRCSRAEGRIAGAAAMALFIFGLAIPGTAIIHAAFWRMNPYASVPVPWHSLLYSTLYACIAALLAVAVAMLLVSGQRRARGRMAHMVDAMTLGNMAIPGLVLGAAYIIAFNGSWLPLYGTPGLLVIAYVAAQVPLLVRFLQAPMGQVHASMSDAARLHGMSWMRRTADVQAPLLLSPFLWGWTIAFGHVFFELPISELLYPAGRAPIGVAIVTLNQKLHYTAEARLALAGIALSLAIAGFMAVVLRFAMIPPMAKEQVA
jgi:iron(III) transport system permease protein